MSQREQSYGRIMVALRTALDTGEEWSTAVLEDAVGRTGSWYAAADSEEYTQAINALGVIADACRAIRAVG